MINPLLSRKCVVPLYALFPPIFLCSKVDHRQFVRFLDVCVQLIHGMWNVDGHRVELQVDGPRIELNMTKAKVESQPK